jgi:RsmE family RNA methyltransferase
MNLILFNHSELNTTESRIKDPHADLSGRPDSVQFFLPRRDERAIHLYNVLHKKPGDTFEAGILGGKLGTGTIIEITDEGLRIALELNIEPPPRTPLRLGVGFPRPIQLRRLLRDCASLGLTAVDLIGTDLGEKSYRDTKLLHDGGSQAAFIEGAVQARDTRLPDLAVYPSIVDWLQTPGIKTHSKLGKTALFAADNVQPKGSFAGIDSLQSAGSAVLAVGCERGWSDRERKLLDNAGFVRLSLGKRALRTETACVAAAVLLMEKLGLL